MFGVLEDLVPQAGAAIESIAALMRSGHACAVAASFGKDSSCLLELALASARRVQAEGCDPLLIVMAVDTLVENPEMSGLARREMARLKSYAQASGLRLEAHVVSPSLRDSFQVSVLGGRSLPSFAGSKAECSVSWKVEPMARLLASLKRTGREGKEVVVLTGSRFEESEARSRKMQERGANATRPVRNQEGLLVLTPIAEWDSDAVWEVIGYCASGMVRCYSDHKELLEVYAAAGGSSCAVVSDMVSGQHRSGCSARTGCFLCTQVSEDKSLTSMVQEQRYDYMSGLVALRNYIAATQYDWTRRHWIGRPVVNGFVRIGPSTYSGSELLALTRYCLSLDAQEEAIALARGEEPRFQILSFEQVVALDCLWSLEGLQLPFTAVTQWREIKDLRTKSYRVPQMVSMPARKMPEPRYVLVGTEHEASQHDGSGLQDWVAQALTPSGDSGCMGTTTLASGVEVLDINTSGSLEVDIESAAFALAYDQDRMEEIRAQASRGGSWTSGYRWWLQRGAVSVSRGSRSQLDAVLRRTVMKERLGLAGQVNLKEVIARSIGAAEMGQRSGQATVWEPELAL